MSATTSSAFALATLDPYTGNSDSAPGATNSGGSVDDAAGASGASMSNVGLSHGALIAIIVIVVVVAILGVASATLFYIAKKREWKVRETLRKSTRKVINALTPRRSEFPSDVKDGPPRSRAGRTRLDDVPPTPRLKPEDLEKGMGGVRVKTRQFSR